MRLSTVDFDKLIEVYQKTNKDLSCIVGPLYGKMNVLGADNTPIDKIYHRTVYNRSEMIEILKQSGYVKIEYYDWKEHVHSEYDDQSQSYFPHMEKEKGIHIMQNIQAIK